MQFFFDLETALLNAAIFLNDASNMDSGCWWVEAVLTSTHNLCFLSQTSRNDVNPCETHFSLYKVGFPSVFMTRTCKRDEMQRESKDDQATICPKIHILIASLFSRQPITPHFK